MPDHVFSNIYLQPGRTGFLCEPIQMKSFCIVLEIEFFWRMRVFTEMDLHFLLRYEAGFVFGKVLLKLFAVV